MIEIIGTANSRALRTVWVAEELGLHYEYRMLDFSKREHRHQDYLELNPMGKVPLLVVDGETIAESGAQCMYLADSDELQRMAPKAGTLERAKHDQWMYMIATELEQPIWTKAKHKFALPAEVRIDSIGPAIMHEFAHAANAASILLGDDHFVCGNKFTVADVFLTHTLLWASMAKMAPEHDNLVEYLSRHTQRPAFLKAVAIERGDA